nr:acyl-CoA dehydrogenase family protein [Rhodococcus wratislaviensis]GLK37890.1 acyl-CoA dehydrogenase [Rhodococcus wratislaviensis]
MSSTPSNPDHGDLEAVRELARGFFTKEVAPFEDTFIYQGFPDRTVYRKAGELGLLCMSVPEQYGGGGGTFAHEAILFEEQVRAGDSALQLGVHTGIVPHYILAYGTEEQKHRWLPKLASGEWIGAIAMTEPGTGSDLQAISTRAVRSGDDYLVSGAKTFISNGRNCDLLIIAAKTDATARAAGVSLLVAEVSDDTPGFERGRVLHKIGQQGQDTTELFFEDLRVPAAHLLGPAEGQGFMQLMQQLPNERLICAVASVAMIERAVELTVAYTKDRQVFGKPLMTMQNTKFELAECATIARVARTFVDDCVDRHLRGDLDVPTAAMAKYWASDQQCSVVDRCLQLFGGYGYTTEFPIARMFTDSRIQKIYAGANEVMKDIIARSL